MTPGVGKLLLGSSANDATIDPQVPSWVFFYGSIPTARGIWYTIIAPGIWYTIIVASLENAKCYANQFYVDAT